MNQYTDCNVIHKKEPIQRYNNPMYSTVVGISILKNKDILKVFKSLRGNGT